MDEIVGRKESLYEKHHKIQAREVDGPFDRFRNISTIILLGFYYVLPWFRWSGRQAVLFDLPARKFYIFELTLWPQDFIYLTWLLIMAALLLFFATAVAGRVWCGYACPQTIWTNAFVWMERITEGKFHKRIKLDRNRYTKEWWARKLAKRVLWFGFALWTGFTFVGYFTPIDTLGARMLRFDLGGWEFFWVAFYSFATYGNAGHLREQVCKYMCPYARCQRAMFDRDPLIVSYDTARGEPRGGRRRGTDLAAEGLGDCTDCNICVQVCPTGIDIRKGLQYECTTCASCIDACNGVMDRMGYPRGLIRYTTQHSLDGKQTHLLRPRTVLYGVVLLALFAGFVVSILNRVPMQLDVIRDRNALYRTLSDGRIENVYTLKLQNKTEERQEFRLFVNGIPGMAIETEPATPRLEAGAVASIAARVQADPRTVRGGGHVVVFSAQRVDDATLNVSREARFMMPLR
ncbi:MAG: cytochrome c oxidase accessory protein CcoG [Gammaproteobacteria bacterium]